MSERQIERSTQDSLETVTERTVTIRTYDYDDTADTHTGRPKQQTANSPYTGVPAFVSTQTSPAVHGDPSGQDIEYELRARIPADAGPVVDGVLAGPDATDAYPSEVDVDGTTYTVQRVFDDHAGFVQLALADT